jgi:cobalt-zinc-cadmium efflux system outer membrane protein
MELAATAAYADAPLTEGTVVRLAKENDPRAQALRMETALAQAELMEENLYPEPVLGWEREHLPTTPSEVEDTISLTVPLEVSGRRGVRRALARTEVAERLGAAAKSQNQIVRRALLLFYTALAANERAALAKRSVNQLMEAARVLRRRREVGTASGYEEHRLQLAAELAKSALNEAEAEAHALRHELALVLGLDPNRTELRGQLALGAAPGSLSSPDRLSARPSLGFAKTSLAEARAAQDSAESAWVPAMALTGGLRRVDSDAVRYGYVAGVSISLPVFSSGRHWRARAEARAGVAAARLRATQRDARIESARAKAELTLAIRQLRQIEDVMLERVERLERAALSGYREGQRSVVELLDAQRMRTQVEQRQIDFSLRARHAEVRLRAARGEFE